MQAIKRRTLAPTSWFATLMLVISGCAYQPPPELVGQDLLRSYFQPGVYAGIEQTRISRDCVVFHPINMNDERHPIVIWGNGTYASPASYRLMLEHWASWGFVVVAAMTPNAGSGREMLECLDDIRNEYSRRESVFFGKVDTTRVAAAGHSQGGGGALMMGRDLRVDTVIAIQPYTRGPRFVPQVISDLKGPLLLLSGTEDVTAAPDIHQQPVFEQSPVDTTWLTLRGATHLAPMQTGGSYLGPMTAWLRWILWDDPVPAPLFEGDNCVLCQQDNWTVNRKAQSQ